MTISTTQSRIGYNGNGVTDEFAFPYPFLENSDLVVILTDSTGADTTLILNTDYTVAGAGNPSGGTVTVSTAPAVGERLTILRVMSLTQETDYITGDPFPAESHERALDRLTMIAQQLQEELDRSAKLPVTSEADAESLVADIITLADIADDISDVAAIDAQVSTVAGISGNVTTVAGISANVTTVAGNTSNINAVVANQANIDTVATNIGDVQTAATNIAAIQTAPQAAIDAEAARDKAQQWAEEAEDVPVEPGQYSAYHWAQKAQDFATGAAENISFDPTGTDFTATNVQALGEEIDTTKQDTLVSGTNIKTVGGQSLLGAGDIAIAAGWLPAAVFTNSGSYTLQAGREYFIVALGAGGCGARNTQNSGRASGGNAGGLCAKSVSPSSNTELTIVVGSGSGRPAGGSNSNGIAGGDTTVTGTGISMTAPGGVGGVQGASGTQQPPAPATPTGGDINIAGGRAGAASGGETAGAAILGGNSANKSSGRGGWVTPINPDAGTIIPAVEFPLGIDTRIAFALNVAQAHSGAFAPVGVGGKGGSTDISYKDLLSFGAGSGGNHSYTSGGGTSISIDKAGDGVVVILEKAQ